MILVPHTSVSQFFQSWVWKHFPVSLPEHPFCYDHHYLSALLIYKQCMTSGVVYCNIFCRCQQQKNWETRESNFIQTIWRSTSCHRCWWLWVIQVEDRLSTFDLWPLLLFPNWINDWCWWWFFCMFLFLILFLVLFPRDCIFIIRLMPVWMKDILLLVLIITCWKSTYWNWCSM